mgnify:CR=1 FL=1
MIVYHGTNIIMEDPVMHVCGHNEDFFITRT